jgi:hypothetical protein
VNCNLIFARLLCRKVNREDMHKPIVCLFHGPGFDTNQAIWEIICKI